MHKIVLFHSLLFAFKLKLHYEDIRLVIQPYTKAIFSLHALTFMYIGRVYHFPFVLNSLSSDFTFMFFTVSVRKCRKQSLLVPDHDRSYHVESN